MLLGRALGQRLEPVGIVGHAVLLGPLHHTCCHGIGDITLQARAVVDDVDHLLVDILRQVLVHLLTVEDLLSEILIRSLTRCLYVEGLLCESLADHLKS